MKTFTYAIGDIHGRLDTLLKSIEMIEEHRASHDADAIVVFLGDYVDRGPDSKPVCDILMAGPKTDRTEWKCLQGNHEVMFIEAHRGGLSEVDFWANNGGTETFESFGGYAPKQYVEWMEQLLKYYYDGERVFVHAGVKPEYRLDEMPESVLQWMRRKEYDDPVFPLGYVVHGHTPQMGVPLVLENRCDLDVYSVITGKVCVGIFEKGVPGKPIGFLEHMLGYKSID